jgi:hypothetical protein
MGRCASLRSAHPTIANVDKINLSRNVCILLVPHRGKKLKVFTSVFIDFTSELDNETKFLRELRRQLRIGLEKLPEKQLGRAVYVIRMTGDFLIAYEKGNSPVLYIGRGYLNQRLAAHIKNWRHEVRRFGSGVGGEIRVASPRRKKRQDFYKNVEADLLGQFANRYDSLPFFNRRYEKKYGGRIHSYQREESKAMRGAIMIGKGYRPKWALKPTRANTGFATFMKGKRVE